MNVCRRYSEDAHNCGECSKCLRTLLTLDILGKLDDFADIFDIDAYQKQSLNNKAKCVAKVDTDVFAKKILDLAAEKNFPMPQRRDCYVLGKQVVIFD